MVHFVGAGCGAPDLITVRGAKADRRRGCADLCGFAGKPGGFEIRRAGLRNSRQRASDAGAQVIETVKTPRRGAKPPFAYTLAIQASMARSVNSSTCWKASV